MSVSPTSASASSVQYPIMINGFLVYSAAGAQLAAQGLNPNTNQFPKSSNSTSATGQATAIRSPLKLPPASELKTVSAASQITTKSNLYRPTASTGVSYSGYNQNGSSVGSGSSVLRGTVLNLYA
ncbi:MAG TPA: hypothetical protein HPQ04_03730 [Rhodospirillaceae bacterium]|nr:hypothetical protein [Rhodospirillaceae bacterium]